MVFPPRQAALDAPGLGLRPGLALADLALLLGILLPAAVAFWRVRPAAGALLVPYLLWASFALAMNATIWLRNRGA